MPRYFLEIFFILHVFHRENIRAIMCCFKFGALRPCQIVMVISSGSFNPLALFLGWIDSVDGKPVVCTYFLPLIDNSLRKHAYSNILKKLPPKNENFLMKHSDILHISSQNIDCRYSSEPLQRSGSNAYPQSMQQYEK